MILYSGTRNASSWSFRAWLALTEAGIAFEERTVDLRLPQRHAELAQIAAFSPPGAVPVLVDGQHVIYDSLAIMEYANDLTDADLLPSNVKLRAEARSLLAWQHEGLSNICPRLSFESAFYPVRRAMTADEMAGANRLFSTWEASLARSGGPYLVGSLSLADLAFVPTLVRVLAHVETLDSWPRIAAWSSRLLARGSVQSWMHEATSMLPVELADYWEDAHSILPRVHE